MHESGSKGQEGNSGDIPFFMSLPFEKWLSTGFFAATFIFRKSLAAALFCGPFAHRPTEHSASIKKGSVRCADAKQRGREARGFRVAWEGAIWCCFDALLILILGAMRRN